MQGQKSYQERLFMSFQLSDRIPKDNFYRRLKETLDLSFIRKQTSEYYGKEGQKSIDPVVFFKLILIGYIENLNSDRKIIEHASMRMDMLYFIDYDIDEVLPWHSTLSRTRKLFGEKLFLEVFRKVLSLCIDKGMVCGRRQAIDSALIKANASMNSIVRKEILDDTTDFFNELTDNDEDKRHPIEETKRAKSPMSNKNWTSLSDPDARISKKKFKPLQLNFAAQISVDASSHVICGAMADFADKRDSQSLPSILNQTITNLDNKGVEVKEVLADTNYSSGESLRYLKSKSLCGYIPCHGQYKYQREGFTYHSDGDYYTCNQGVKIPFKKISIRKDNTRKIYWSSKIDCGNCVEKEKCLGQKKFRILEDTIDKPYYDRMHERVKTKLGRQMKKIRSATVEPVLGSLLDFTGMKKVRTRGIELANKHVLLAATAYNIKKLLKFIMAKSIAKTGRCLLLRQQTSRFDLICHLLLFRSLRLLNSGK